MAAFRRLLGRVLGVKGRLNRLVDLAHEGGTGVFVTVDEVHGAQSSGLRELAAIVQHAIREDRNLAFAAAGLPAAMSELLVHDPVLLFLRRSERFNLGTVDPSDVREALLIDSELVIATRRGRIDMALPGLKSHLRSRDIDGHPDTRIGI